MYPLPAALSAALAGSLVQGVARLMARHPDGTVRRTWDLDEGILLSGDVVADLGRDARRSASLVLSNRTGALSPVGYDDLFAEGSRLSIERGALVAGSPVTVPLIDGFVTACEPAMRGTIAVSIESALSAAAQPAGTTDVLTAGTYLGAAIRRLIVPVLPFATWVIDDLDRAVGSDVPVLPGDDRLRLALTLARDGGLEVFDDRLGRIVVRPRPDPTSAPVVRTFASPMDLTRRVSRRPVNAQLVEASPGAGEPFWALATVDDPVSPIHPSRIGLRMGEVVRSDTIASPDTALAVARDRLAYRALAQDGVSTTEIPVLDVDEGDVCAWAEPISGADGRFRIDSISVPVLSGATTISATRVVPLWAP